MKTVALRSLGCKVNAYETEQIQQKLEEIGYIIVPFDNVADIYIVNTCSVTNIADHKSRQMLHRAKRQNPDAIVVAVGCYAQTGREALEADPDIDLVISNPDKMRLPQILAEQTPPDTVDEVRSDAGEVASRTRSFIKIEDGCNRFCTYCVIPYARGRVSSREISDVVSEARDRVRQGYKEIVLTGIHICSFGTDRGAEELTGLLAELNDIEGLYRIRLSSMEPAFITPDWIGRVRGLDKLCPHFHLSLQSGSDSVLARMNRHYTADEYYERVCMLRETFDDPAITTDIIVGFPGETPDEFEQTCDFVRKIDFAQLHVFKYSRRDGTVAASMPDQIPEHTKADRSDRLIALGDELSTGYIKRHIGRSAVLLTEERKMIDGEPYLIGHTAEYIVSGIRLGTTDTAPVPNQCVSGTYSDTLSDGTVCFIPK